MRRILTALLAPLVMAAGLVWIGAAPASACSCVAEGTAYHLRNADAVFAGTVTGADASSYDVAVDTVFRGEVTGRAVVETDGRGDTCALEGIDEGGAYVFFADLTDDGGLYANLCGGTAPADDDLRDDVAARTGRADTPQPAPVAHEGWPGWLLPVGGVVIGLGLVAALLRRRRA